MTRHTLPACLPLLAAVLQLAACQPADDRSAPAVDAAPAVPAPAAATDDAANASPGKPTAPIAIDYQVVGTPVVGQPVNVNLEVSSSLPDAPVTLNYRVNDAATLAFPESQVERLSLGAIGNARPARHQVTVVPQREGRLYLNVSAEVDTEGGTLMKSMAIPIQVGRSPGNRQPNGQLQEDADGEPVISLPADDR